MTLRRIQPEDSRLVEDLIRDNPFKEDQIQFQRLDRDLLVRFHSNRILSRSAHEERPVFVFEAGGKRALVGVSEPSHHSSLFGKRIFSLDPVITYTLRGDEKRQALKEVGRVVEERGGEIVWASGDEAEEGLVESYAGLGWCYSGTTVRMSRWTAGSLLPEKETGIEIREAERGDLAEIQEMAGTSHRHSRFFRDPNLPAARKGAVFPDYVRRCFGSSLRPLLVAVDHSGKAMGFSLLLLPEGQEKDLGRRIGIIDFIVVKTVAQRKGVGGGLLRESFRLIEKGGYEVVELKTMLDNRQAIGFYQRHGFRILSSEMHFSMGERGAQ